MTKFDLTLGDTGSAVEFELEDDSGDIDPYGQETDIDSGDEGGDEGEEATIWVKNLWCFPQVPVFTARSGLQEGVFNDNANPTPLDPSGSFSRTNLYNTSREKQTDMPGMWLLLLFHNCCAILSLQGKLCNWEWDGSGTGNILFTLWFVAFSALMCKVCTV